MKAPFTLSMLTAAALLLGAAATTSETPETTAPDSVWDQGRATMSREDRALTPPPGAVPAGHRWALVGPQISEDSCNGQSKKQPIRSTYCFSLFGDPTGDEGWFYWSVVQSY